MLIWLAVLILVSVIFFCTLGSAALQAIPLERLWKLRGGGGRNAAGVEYWITHSQQITWSFRVLSRISCVALALLLAGRGQKGVVRAPRHQPLGDNLALAHQARPLGRLRGPLRAPFCPESIARPGGGGSLSESVPSLPR